MCDPPIKQKSRSEKVAYQPDSIGLTHCNIWHSRVGSDNDNSSDDLLIATLDGLFKRLRDDNHVDPHTILVWDISRTPVIEAVEILDLVGRYPCGGPGSQWSAADFVEILQEKHNQYRQSMASHEIANDDPEITPSSGTVVLVISEQSGRGHRWVGLSALIEPRQ